MNGMTRSSAASHASGVTELAVKKEVNVIEKRSCLWNGSRRE